MRHQARVLVELRQRQIRHDADEAQEGECDRETDADLALGGEVSAQERCGGTRPLAVCPLHCRGSRTFLHRRRLFLTELRRKGFGHDAEATARGWPADWKVNFSSVCARESRSAVPRSPARCRVDTSRLPSNRTE